MQMEMETGGGGGGGGEEGELSSLSSSSQSLYLRLHHTKDIDNVQWYRFPIPVDGKSKFVDPIPIPFSKSNLSSSADIVGCGSSIYTLGDIREMGKRERWVSTVTTAVYRYETADPNPKWTKVKDMNICRIRPQAVVLGEKIYVMGGFPSWSLLTPVEVVEFCFQATASQVLELLTPDESEKFKTFLKYKYYRLDDEFGKNLLKNYEDLCYKLHSLLWAECYYPEDNIWKLFGSDLYPLMDPDKVGDCTVVASAVSDNEMLLVSNASASKKSYLYNVETRKAVVYHEENPFHKCKYRVYPTAALRGSTLYCHNWEYDMHNRLVYAYRYNKDDDDDGWVKASIPKQDYDPCIVQHALLTSGSTHDGYHQLHLLELNPFCFSNNLSFGTLKLQTLQVPDAGPLGKSLDSPFQVTLQAVTQKDSLFSGAVILSDPELVQEGLLTLSVSNPAVTGFHGPMTDPYVVAYLHPLEMKISKFDSFFNLNVQCKEEQSVTFEIFDGDIEQEKVLGKANLDLGRLTDRHEEEFNLILDAPSSDTCETNDEKRRDLRVKVEYRPFKKEELIAMELDRAKRKRVDSVAVDSSLIKSRKLM